jgi:hypothetical protein
VLCCLLVASNHPVLGRGDCCSLLRTLLVVDLVLNHNMLPGSCCSLPFLVFLSHGLTDVAGTFGTRSISDRGDLRSPLAPAGPPMTLAEEVDTLTSQLTDVFERRAIASKGSRTDKRVYAGELQSRYAGELHGIKKSEPVMEIAMRGADSPTLRSLASIYARDRRRQNLLERDLATLSRLLESVDVHSPPTSDHDDSHHSVSDTEDA